MYYEAPFASHPCIILIYEVNLIMTCCVSTMLAEYDADGADIDEPVDSNMGSINLDPFDYVYSNIPDSTHILKHAANCDHCQAKKFQYETDGFCCRNGEIELSEPEPIPEKMKLWSCTDADSRHFWESIRFFN